MDLPCDWQFNQHNVLHRTQYLLETGLWSDCNFIVGLEPNQQILKGHKLFLAMASPVFQAMFFGNMSEKCDMIPIRDVDPEAFKTLLKFIYTDQFNVHCFELIYELCYCAKKYMLPSLVDKCINSLYSVSTKEVCRTYEFAKFFEESALMCNCLNIICTRTNEVLEEPSWKDVQLDTVLTVLDQEELHISSELELFNALESWAKAECIRKYLDPNNGKCLKSVIGNALSKIRFLSLDAKSLAHGPGISLLLTQDEIFSLLMNNLGSGHKIPEGFTIIKQNRGTRCKTSVMDHHKASPSIFSHQYGQLVSYPPPSTESDKRKILVTPSSSIPSQGLKKAKYFYTEEPSCIAIEGVQVPSQVMKEDVKHLVIPSYTELLYAHLLDWDGTRLTYTHFSTKVDTDTLVEIIFNRSICIQKNKVYRIEVVFNKSGWYPTGYCSQTMTCDSVLFSFGIESNSVDIQDGLIRSIIFNK
ncbi:PREDICTED: BTB/POZ domain-containing protein 2-like isoform X2 [Eufriesea mexicana]|uniref:BTB/POZ domain-containing protein 2-like isoform X2 n=1 Tax=Eufriesea mexicana TaxID=516756 RepID=UPI00083C4482|nr:PREDICTED: BTB/POZ domain-containing protein 2-like isoform X2 [Eufriesea mexicana]